MRRVVRVPEHIAGTSFPCYVDAADRKERPSTAEINVQAIDDGQKVIDLMEALKDALDNGETIAESRRDSEA